MNIDILILQDGSDDGKNTKYYLHGVLDVKEAENYLSLSLERGLKLIDKFNISVDKLDDVNWLTCKYEGPRNGFMKGFDEIFRY